MFVYVRRHIPIKPFMIGYLALVLVLSSVMFAAYDRLWQGAVIVVLCAAFDVVWTYLRNRIWYIPYSSFISGLIMALVGTSSGSGVLGLAAVSFFAVFSKQVIHLSRLRHIFNPAAFSLFVFSFLGALYPALNIFMATWWARFSLSMAFYYSNTRGTAR
ncbi:MAG: hypothetical protein A3A24_03650 [Candidatus Buchananbacteria bacterium RIFCSPLOWO2_01_FULL_46_12]|uniref:Prepilin type IV endopeptidase peptidase domain-containing protein n=1 Tax=Candidatus Buchananbacteria bacterium RIFCSPLOWO2_01_FULL_46_12 TaxID=1797546 RepID=A0A1G1YUG5_9BACT|nr:MAG: hypothetical protein A3A24_03650 [Candidatus Buchananbacteria bacterium RIFCSPLOWO2_01_FULL_46_12]